ncbi:hypothetical protein Vretifemale_19895, partial [Volvox reticuliferus]
LRSSSAGPEYEHEDDTDEHAVGRTSRHLEAPTTANGNDNDNVNGFGAVQLSTSTSGAAAATVTTPVLVGRRSTGNDKAWSAPPPSPAPATFALSGEAGAASGGIYGSLWARPASPPAAAGVQQTT